VPHRSEHGDAVQPTKEQSLRMKRYSEELRQKQVEGERKQRENNFLRMSLRNSQKINALSEVPALRGVANVAFQEDPHVAVTQQQLPNLLSLVDTAYRIQQLSSSVNSSCAALPPAMTALESILANKDFQRGLLLNEKVRLIICVNKGSHLLQRVAFSLVADAFAPLANLGKFSRLRRRLSLFY
jgi:hypothetical protein